MGVIYYQRKRPAVVEWVEVEAAEVVGGCVGVCPCVGCGTVGAELAVVSGCLGMGRGEG